MTLIDQTTPLLLNRTAWAVRWRDPTESSRLAHVVLPYALELLGAIHGKRGRTARARACLDEGLKIARADGDARAECQITHRLAGLAFGDGRLREAIAALNLGCTLAREMDYLLWGKNLCRNLARAHEACGDIRRAFGAQKTLNGLLERQTA